MRARPPRNMVATTPNNNPAWAIDGLIITVAVLMDPARRMAILSVGPSGNTKHSKLTPVPTTNRTGLARLTRPRGSQTILGHIAIWIIQYRPSVICRRRTSILIPDGTMTSLLIIPIDFRRLLLSLNLVNLLLTTPPTSTIVLDILLVCQILRWAPLLLTKLTMILAPVPCLYAPLPITRQSTHSSCAITLPHLITQYPGLTQLALLLPLLLALQTNAETNGELEK